MPRKEDALLLADVAQMYYRDDLTQEQIARNTGVSRSSVSRLLREARDRGVVQVIIHHPFRTEPALETALRERLGLRDCLVLATPGGGDDLVDVGSVPSRVGSLAARYLQERISNDSILGVGWGSMVDHVVRSDYLTGKRGTIVVQIQGGVGGDAQDTGGARIVGRLSRSLNASAQYLNAPLVVADTSVKSGLLRDPHIRRTLDIGKRAHAILVGVGAVSPKSGLYRAGYVSDSDLDHIAGEGAVGDICGWYFRQDGSLCDLELNGRLVSLGAELIRKVPLRVGVSSGIEKILPNIGASRSGLIDVLVTDQGAAEGMLEILESEQLDE